MDVTVVAVAGAGRRKAEYSFRIGRLERETAFDQRIENPVQRDPVERRAVDGDELRFEFGVAERLVSGKQCREHAQATVRHLEANCAKQRVGRVGVCSVHVGMKTRLR